MRRSGILMPVFSLPSRYGIGCFSREAYEFADFLKKSGQTLWQILPLGPTGYGDSPYQSFSSFAGNPYFIDLDTLREEGLLKEEDYARADFGSNPVKIDYGKMYRARFAVLRKAYRRWDKSRDAGYAQFLKKQSYWLEDYCLYMAVKDSFGGKAWTEWDDDIRLRRPEALKRCREKLAEDIDFYRFLQWEFTRQWTRLKQYVNGLGIRIVGDIPIYVSADGSDAWSDPSLFQFDDNSRPIRVAGCPPDAFSADGQLWGNPIYRWDVQEKTGYAWWIRRMSRCFELYDIVRVDHFRGFDEYYSIPYGAKNAVHGRWEPGPGMKLFRALEKHFGSSVPLIAEDLGYLTDSVRKLVRDSGYPGMKVLEFAFDSREESNYMPYCYPNNCVVYTGTHDNQTLYAWVDELDPQDRRLLLDYLGIDGNDRVEVVWGVIRAAMESVADTAVIPLWDYLCLGADCRVNRPSTTGTNWRWRMKAGALTPELGAKIRRLTQVSGRLKG
ncbi:MAG: 4-alpha-glucanotransferase [Lachnospiraceae bacterium]